MDKIFKSFTVFGIFCFLFMQGCSSWNITSLKNKPVTVKTPPPENISIQQDGRIINKDGWQFPSTQGLKVGRTVFVTMKSVDGKSFQVKKNVFVTKENTFFTVDGFDENLTSLYGQLDLYAIRDFNLNGKIFMYSIAAMKVGEYTNKNSNTPGKIIEYQLLDTDGDGKFETFAKNVKNATDNLIPKWATE